jgi:hypothetical protein
MPSSTILPETTSWGLRTRESSGGFFGAVAGLALPPAGSHTRCGGFLPLWCAKVPYMMPVARRDREKALPDAWRRGSRSGCCGVIDVRRRLVMLLHIGREPGLELAHQRAEARHDGDRLEQRP